MSSSLSYPVPLIPQTDKLSCWAASMAMLLSYRKNASFSPESLANEVDRSLRTSYDWDMLEDVKDHFGFQDISLPSDASLYVSPQQWYDWLDQFGPLWVTIVGTPSHAIITSGITGDLTFEGATMSILNPWDTTINFDDDEIDFHPYNNGRSYISSFQGFANDFGNLGLGQPPGNWRILYLPS